MRFVISGRFRPAGVLSPGDAVTLAVRDWVVVRRWLASGEVLAWGAIGTRDRSALLVEAESAAAAHALAGRLPSAEFADRRVWRSDRGVAGVHRRGATEEARERWAAAGRRACGAGA